MNKIILSSSSSSFLPLFSRRKKLMTYSCFSHILPRCPQPCNTTDNTSCYPHVSLFELRPEPILLSRSPAQIKRICYTTNSFFFQMVFFFYTGCYFVRVNSFYPREVDGRPHDKQGLPICERDGLYSQSTQKF